MDPADAVQSARDALARHAWQESFDGFRAAAATRALSAEDLEALSEAAFWSGHSAESLDARQRAFAEYEDAGRPSEAAAAALKVGGLHFLRGDESVASGWVGRAQRLLVELPECPAHAQLAWIESQLIMTSKDHEQALARARDAEGIARRVGDRDTAVLSVALQGYQRMHTGDIADGMRLLDEALAIATAGELGPWATAEIFCEMVVSCLDVADYERATEWLETAERAGQDMVCFPGCCRVHRATVLRHRGEWPEAHREAHQARAECAGIERFHEGMALTEMGELYRCKGDLGLAENAFGEAYEKGWIPQPGLALVLFAKDDLAGALRMIQRSVEHAKDEPGALVHLLPAQVDIALAAGEDVIAAAAADRLAQVASILGTSAAAVGANASVAGMLSHRRGDLSTAVSQLELSVRSWQRARSPYEASQARMRLASVFEELGDAGSANLELATARKTFERLGAGPEAREAARRLGGDAPVHSACTFMFTDIVNSTSLLTSIGDNAWHGVRQWHDRTVTAIVGEHQGRIVKETGDGFFASFDDVALGVDCAVAIQRALEAHRHSDGFAPSVRIGLHVGTAISVDDDYTGRDVVVAARIGALASAEEILVSAAVADRLGTHVRVLERTAASLKGIPEAFEVAAVAWH